MSASTFTSTLTLSDRSPNHGKLLSSVSLEAMDVDRDVQHPSSRDRPQGNDIMNLALDSTHKSASEVRIPGLLVGNDVAPTTQQPPQPAVLERPREENDGTGDAPEAQSQLGKILSLTVLSHLQGLV